MPLILLAGSSPSHNRKLRPHAESWDENAIPNAKSLHGDGRESDGHDNTGRVRRQCPVSRLAGALVHEELQVMKGDMATLSIPPGLITW